MANTPKNSIPQSSALQILAANLPGTTSPAVEQTIRDNPATEAGLGFNMEGAKAIPSSDTHRRPPQKVNPTALTSLASSLNFASNTVQGPTSIIELSRALNVSGNGPQLMYEWVYSNVDWEPGWGVQKGALGAITDGAGNAFDQSLLLANLLRQAGFTANIVQGTIRLTEAQFVAWWGVNDIFGAQSYAGNLFVPIVTPPTFNGTNWYMDIKHVWVQYINGATTIVFDPSIKSYTRTTGRSDLATILGYNATTFMTNAQSGATVTTDYAQNMNRTNISNDLKTMSANLVTWIAANKPDAQVDDIIGGQTINPPTLPITQSTLPYEAPGDVPTVWTGDVPASFKPTLQIQFPNWNTPGVWDFTYVTTSDALAAKRLTLFFDGSNVPKLYLDGTLVATGLAQPVGTFTSIFITVTQPAHASSNYPQSFQQFYQTNFQWWQTGIRSGTGYLIGNAWGNAGRGYLDLHANNLAANIASGGASNSEPVLGEQLAVMWGSWLSQNSRVTDMVNRIKKCKTAYNHQVGVLYYNPLGSPTDYCGMDIGGVSASSDYLPNDSTFATQTQINDTVVAMHGVALEAATSTQLVGSGKGASSTTVLDAANAAGLRIYKGNSSNWNTGSNISATLVANGYNSTDMTNIFNAYINFGYNVLIPGNPNQTIDSWTGWGYFAFPNSGAFGIINGGFKGNQKKGKPNKPTTNPIPGKNQGGQVHNNDPIGVFSGDFYYTRTDITLGSSEYPYQIDFTRNYSSQNQFANGALGRGWTHTHNINAQTSSDGLLSMGDLFCAQGALSIAELFVCTDLLTDTTRPVSKMVTISLADSWWIDQIVNNTVSLSFAEGTHVFVKQPDGTYTSPGTFPGTLTLVAGNFVFTTREGIKYNFNAAGQITSKVFPEGVTISYSYTGGVLSTISNGLGRTLTLTYTGALLTSVSDGTGRSISYGYDASNNLVTFTNAAGKSHTYQYDQPGRMTKYFTPANPTIAYCTNVYDSLSRVKTQSNALSQPWTYYFAGSRTQIVDPLANTEVLYFNRRGAVTKHIDPLGFQSTNVFDGLNRIVSKTFPEGNQLQWTYDKNNNVLTKTMVPKVGSGLTNIQMIWTYDPVWATMKTAQDGRGNITTYSYDVTTGKLIKVQRPSIAGQTPVINFKYNSRGQLLSRVDETGIQTQFTYDAATEKLLSQIVNTNWRCTVGGTATAGNVLTINVNDAGLPGGTKAKSYTVVAGNTLAQIATGLANAVNADTQLAALGIIAYVNAAVLSLSTSPGNSTTFTGSTSPGATATLTFTAGINLTTSLGYDTVGNRTNVTDRNGNLRVYQFDAERRKTQLTAPAPFSYLTKWGYDFNGNLTSVQKQKTSAPTWQITTISYSVTEKLKTITDPMGFITSYSYDGKDRLQSATDPELRVYQFAYDGLDRLAFVTDPSSIVFDTRTYSNNGQLKTRKDARNNVTQYSYDGHDRLDTTTFADTTFERNSSYDANGNVLTHLTRSGSSIVMTYDVLNRLSTKAPTGQPTVTNTYDLAGRLVSASKPVVAGDPSSGSLSFSFDSAGRFVNESYPDGKKVIHVLDSNGNRTKTTWPDGYFINRVFDQLDRLTDIKLNGATANAVHYTYDQLSRRATATLSNGVVTTYGFQDNDDLTSLAHSYVGSAVTFTYGYNKAHQLTSNNVSDSAYLWHPSAAGTSSYGVADNVNKYPTVGAATYSYDANKNLTGDGVWTFTYDTEKHLLTANKTGVSASYLYDPIQRQTQKTVGTTKTRFIYDGNQLIADYNGTSGALLNRYINVGVDEQVIQVTSAGVVSFFHQDKQNSVIATSGNTGAVTNKYKYSPYGESAALTGTSFGYTGQRYDAETALYYYKARMYSTVLGRFLQPDPIGYDGGRFLNLYEYVANDPLNFTDPSGLTPPTSDGGGGEGGGGGDSPQSPDGKPPEGPNPPDDTPPDDGGTPPDDGGTPPDDGGTPPDEPYTPPDNFDPEVWEFIKDLLNKLNPNYIGPQKPWVPGLGF